MSNIIELIIEYQKNKKEEYFKEIMNMLAPMIGKFSKKVGRMYRRDVLQDLKFGTFLLLNTMRVKESNLDYGHFTSDNLKLLSEHKFSASVLEEVFENKYVKNYINEFGTVLLEDAFLSKENFQKFNKAFGLFNAKNQFFKLLDLRYKSIIGIFYRKNGAYIENVILSLNTVNEDGDEVIDCIVDYSVEKCPTSFLEYGFLKEDAEFLNLFIERNKVLSQREVSKKTGTSQQYVSKKLKVLKEKYKNKIIV